VEQSEESNARYHRLETMVSCQSKRWNRDTCGQETLLREVLDKAGRLCYGDREVVGWLDGFSWQKISDRSLQCLTSLLDSGKFIKIALIEKGRPSGEDDDGNERSCFE